MRISIRRYAQLPDVLVGAVCKVYFDAFDPGTAQCAQEQICYTRDDFERVLSDERYIKIVALDDVENVLGVLIVTNVVDLCRDAYASPEFFRRQYSDACKGGYFFYITALAVLPSRQHAGAGIELARECIRYGRSIDTRARFAYDFSERKNASLNDALGRLWAHEFGGGSCDLADRQVFVVY